MKWFLVLLATHVIAARLFAALVRPPNNNELLIYREWVYCPACGGLAQLTTVFSLSVARWAGYRVVARKTGIARSEGSAAAPLAHPLD